MSAEAASPQPRGQMVDIGDGRRLHIICAGPAAGARPTVLLEAGAFGFSADWAAVQAKLADVGLRSCAYDRAGLGFSDPGPPPRDSNAIVDDLETLLAKEGETGPLILCGHSMAGLHLRVFAARDPSRVVGVVLVDAVTPEPWTRPPSARAWPIPTCCAAGLAGARPSGLLRPLGASFGDAIGLPPQAKAEKHRAFGDPRHNRWAAAEVDAWPQDAAEAAPPGPTIRLAGGGGADRRRAISGAPGTPPSCAGEGLEAGFRAPCAGRQPRLAAGRALRRPHRRGDPRVEQRGESKGLLGICRLGEGMTTALQLDGVTKRYGAFTAVRDLSFQVKPAPSSASSAPTAPARPPRCA